MQATDWNSVFRRLCVELKYVNQPPDWMAVLMSELAQHRVRFSKYGAAIQQECQELVV
jgi:hypothetical protein